jgi:hypothetical protein
MTTECLPHQARVNITTIHNLLPSMGTVLVDECYVRCSEVETRELGDGLVLDTSCTTGPGHSDSV